MAYRPNIGDKGIFTLKAPFDVLLTPKTLYTCQDVRTINSYIAAGESVYEKFYSPLDVSNDEYQQDIANNVYIVGLQAGTGEWVYVPSSFISFAPSNNGVKYIPVVLGISIGAIPDEFNLESIIQQCNDLVTSTLGIIPEVKGVVVGSPKWFTSEEHELMEEARKEKIATATSPVIIANMLKDENDRLKKIVSEYEKLFKMTLPTSVTTP